MRVRVGRETEATEYTHHELARSTVEADRFKDLHLASRGPKGDVTVARPRKKAFQSEC